MQNVTHNPDRYMADLRQLLSHDRKRIGLLLGAGAPKSIYVDETNTIVEEGGQPLIPDIAGLTSAVIEELDGADQQVIETLKKEIEGEVHIEAILTRIRRLAQVIGNSLVHDRSGEYYQKLGEQICKKIGSKVAVNLPRQSNPYSDLVSWISGTQREHSIEVFTSNYDLLLEEAFERARVPYFDGFSGASSPFFDAASVSADELPSRWSRVWKLHGSLGWVDSGDTVTRSADRNATELIYPDHLKYDQVTRLPYSALFERLRKFLTTPDTLLICAGFSFGDSHICAVLDESLAANAHTAILAFQFEKICDGHPTLKLAAARPNISVYSPEEAVINGVRGRWRPGEPLNEEWNEIRLTFWDPRPRDQVGEFTLGDFCKLARFLALTQAHGLQMPGSTQVDEANND